MASQFTCSGEWPDVQPLILMRYCSKAPLMRGPSRDHHRDDPRSRPLLGQPELVLLHDIDAELVVAALQLSRTEHQAEGDRVLRGFRQPFQERTEFTHCLALDGPPEQAGAEFQRLVTRALGPRFAAGVAQGAT